MADKFVATMNKGFHLILHGVTISVQWGPMNYCSNRSLVADYRTTMEKESTESPEAEIAIWRESDGKLLRLSTTDDVIGWCSPVMVGKIIGFLAEKERTDNEIIGFVSAVDEQR